MKRLFSLVCLLLLTLLPLFCALAEDALPSLRVQSASSYLRFGDDWQATVSANLEGVLKISLRESDVWTPLYETELMSGTNDLSVLLQKDGEALSAGNHELRLLLIVQERASSPVYLNIGIIPGDAAGADDELPAATESTAPVPVTPAPTATPQPVPTADPASPTVATRTAGAYTLLSEDTASDPHLTIPSRLTDRASENSYWTMTLGDLSDEQAIWDIMMQPITVLDDGKHTAKETYLVRKTPDTSTKRDNVVGEVTYKSQGVHVVETLEDGWTLIEAYNTSYGDAYKKSGKRQGYGNTAELISGYVQTSVLKSVEPKDQYALLIDKLTQTMYIFEDGKIIGTLLVSTGLVNSSQPWNETPAGEFLIVSWTGGFWAGNLYCAMGLLLNNCCLIHEVPSIVNATSGKKDFSTTEPQLGKKASHGCIRVQRAANETKHGIALEQPQKKHQGADLGGFFPLL